MNMQRRFVVMATFPRNSDAGYFRGPCAGRGMKRYEIVPIIVTGISVIGDAIAIDLMKSLVVR
jgi:hypothetical protein